MNRHDRNHRRVFIKNEHSSLYHSETKVLRKRFTTVDFGVCVGTKKEYVSISSPFKKRTQLMVRLTI